MTLVIGGARSGKSAHAERLVRHQEPPWYYIATAEALDDEMRDRIAGHRARRGAGWRVLEAPLDLCGVLDSVPDGSPALIDCLTLWLSNQLLAGRDVEAETRRLVAVLELKRTPTVVVTNEVGQGIVPDNALARRYRDCAGRLNREVAAIADSVILLIAGIPVRVKDHDELS